MSIYVEIYVNIIQLNTVLSLFRLYEKKLPWVESMTRVMPNFIIPKTSAARKTPQITDVVIHLNPLPLSLKEKGSMLFFNAL